MVLLALQGSGLLCGITWIWLRLSQLRPLSMFQKGEKKEERMKKRAKLCFLSHLWSQGYSTGQRPSPGLHSLGSGHCSPWKGSIQPEWSTGEGNDLSLSCLREIYDLRGKAFQVHSQGHADQHSKVEAHGLQAKGAIMCRLRNQALVSSPCICRKLGFRGIS